MSKNPDIAALIAKSAWVRAETLRIHGLAPETRVASSLSAVEIFVALHYGNIMKFDSKNPRWEERDRLIISKGHGSICYYPILADLGYFDHAELDRICQEGSFLGGIPDTIIPGYETINGSLGHGLGVGCGMAMALKEKGSDATVFVLIGDGELHEGSVWEAITFAGHHRLDNLVAIIDNNRLCMLDHCDKVVSVEPIDERFRIFGWQAKRVDGHDIAALCTSLAASKTRCGAPQVLVADTVKGKGVPSLEQDSLCHIKSLNADQIREAVKGFLP